jgi:hypothetical protein
MATLAVAEIQEEMLGIHLEEILEILVFMVVVLDILVPHLNHNF